MILSYIHGFNSGYHPGGYKIASLQKIAQVTGVSYDSFAMHDEVFQSLLEQLEGMLSPFRPLLDLSGLPKAALAGTSLGGYWAARFGNHFGIPAVLVNPTIHPQLSLKRYVGHKLLNFVTRSRNILRDGVPDSYGDIERSGDFLVLLDKGDEVLDYRVAMEWYGPDAAGSGERGPGKPGRPDSSGGNVVPARSAVNAPGIICFEGGSHRFEHMDSSLPHILKFLKHQPLSP